MAESPSPDRTRVWVMITLAVSLLVCALHVVVVRPRLWPAGAGAIVSGDSVMARLSEPRVMPRISPPELDGGHRAAHRYPRQTRGPGR